MRTPWGAPGWGAWALAVMPGPTGGSGGMSRRAAGPCSGAGAGAVAWSLRPAVVLMLAAAGTVVAVEAVVIFAAGFTWFSPLGFWFLAFLAFLACKMSMAVTPINVLVGLNMRLYLLPEGAQMLQKRMAKHRRFAGPSDPNL